MKTLKSITPIETIIYLFAAFSVFAVGMFIYNVCVHGIAPHVAI